ncbi:MAG: hypothetical protein ABIP01_00110 [Candidatus Limnocylindria bacterium]
MTDRLVADAVAARLGSDAIGRLRSLRRRLWWRRAVRSGLLIAAGTTLLIALVQLIARAFPLEATPWVQVGVIGFALIGWVVDAMRRRPSLIDAARRADEELELRQRLGTALELARHETDDPLEARQLADARARLNAVDLRRAFRPRLARRPLVVAAMGLTMTLLLVAWPNPQDDVIEQRRAAREAAERVAERVEEVADEVGEENVENPDPRREELERQLRELARQLREQGDDREATLARIGSVQEELSRLTDPQAAESDAALTQLARSTSRAATDDPDANPDGEPEEAAQDLEELAEQTDALSPEEAAARAAELRRAAQAGSASQPQAARALAEAADALDAAARSGSEQDRQAAAEALERAADAVRQAESDRKVQRDVARAQSALQEGARQVARAGQPTATSSGQPGTSGQPGASGQPGSSGQPGNQPGSSGQPGSQPGSQPGTQPGNQPGTQPGSQPGTQPGTQPGSGGGTTVRRIPGGGLRTGGFDGPTSGNQGSETDDEGNVLSDFERFGRPGDPDFIAGSGGNGGTDQTGSGTGVGFDNESVVPYASVFDLFNDYAQSALDRQQVPITLKDFVRDYFSRLEPTE